MEQAELKGVLEDSAKEIKSFIKDNNLNYVSKDEAKGFVSQADLDAKLEAQTKSINEAFSQSNRLQIVEDMSAKAQISNFITKNISEIHRAYKGNGMVEFEIDTKAVADITRGSGTLPSALGVLSGTDLAPISNINLRDTGLLSLFNNLSAGTALHTYTEAIPKEGAFLEVAEGVAKPQIDFSWTTRQAPVFKIAAWERLTEESIKDVQGLQGVATDYLFKMHNLKKENVLLFGSGDGLTGIKGADAYATTYAGAGALALTVATPNIMDVINAMITTIYTTRNYTNEMPYTPNVVLVNPIDFFVQFVSAKDADRKTLFPNAQLFQSVNMGGITVMPHIDVTAGQIKCYDLTKYNITNYVGYSVKIGWVNDDFIKNQFVILGESRMHAYVKNLDQKAFLKGVIGTIKTAITAV